MHQLCADTGNQVSLACASTVVWQQTANRSVEAGSLDL